MLSSQKRLAAFQLLNSSLFLLHCPAREAHVRRPEEAHHVPEGHADVDGHAKLDAIARAPQFDHGQAILLLVVPVLRAPVLYPIEWIPRRPRHDLFARVIRREIYQGQVDEDVERHHLQRVDHPRRVLQLLRKRQRREPLACGEPLPELVHHQPVLEASEVGEAEDHEYGVPLVIDLVPLLLVDDDLNHYVRRGRLGGGDAQLEDERVPLSEGSVGFRGSFFGRITAGAVGAGASSDEPVQRGSERHRPSGQHRRREHLALIHTKQPRLKSMASERSNKGSARLFNVAFPAISKVFLAGPRPARPRPPPAHRP
ncbi:hypothetical protein ACHAWF_011128, partial [Thalassiosira exigua]